MSRAAFYVGFLVAFIIGIALAVPQAFAAGFPATPENVNVVRFPLMSGPLNHQMQSVLELQPQTLPVDAKVFNYQRKTGEWKLEWLTAGTQVLVDNHGYIRYKADCGNRIQLVESSLRYQGDRSWSDIRPEVAKAQIKAEPAKPRLRIIPQALVNIWRAIFVEVPNWLLFQDYVHPNPAP